MTESSTNVCTSPATSTSSTSPSSDRVLSTGGRDAADTTQPGKLFSGDRGLPRSTSIQASQLWPITTQDDSTALVHQCMTSCPDFSRGSKQLGVKGYCGFFKTRCYNNKQANAKTKMDSPRLGNWHHYYSRRVSRSQPITPPTFRERIAVRFRRRRPWESPRRSPNSTSTELVMPKFQDGRERRRRARGSLERHSPSDIGSPGQCTPVGE
jgi:hypothetical protein